jgi:5'-phosphate synthase pdxT subunit
MSDAGRAAVGVLALQGDFEAHGRALAELGVRPVYVTRPAHLDGVEALVLPGGESTTIVKLMQAYDLRAPLEAFWRSGRPLLGTCAGAILLARTVMGRPEQDRLGCIDIDVERNGFGRQIDSFECDLDAPLLGPQPLRAVFIRAPRIVRAGPQVEVLARLRGECVLARENNVLVATFHPELTPDRRVHRLLLEMRERRPARSAA